MAKNEYIPIENKKPIETVYEIKNEYDVPSFEEFMKTYESDSKVNYEDLGHGDIGDSKGYGPTTYGTVGLGFYRGDIVINSDFCLDVECNNWGGGGGRKKRLNSVSETLEHAHLLEDGLYFNVSSEVEKKCAVLIREAVRNYDIWGKVMGYIRVKGKFLGDYEWEKNLFYP